MVTLFQSLYTLSLVASDRVSGRIETLKGERGASAVEYALLVGAIALVVIGAIAAFGAKLTALFDGINLSPTTPKAPVTNTP